MNYYELSDCGIMQTTASYKEVEKAIKEAKKAMPDDYDFNDVVNILKEKGFETEAIHTEYIEF